MIDTAFVYNAANINRVNLHSEKNTEKVTAPAVAVNRHAIPYIYMLEISIIMKTMCYTQ